MTEFSVLADRAVQNLRALQEKRSGILKIIAGVRFNANEDLQSTHANLHEEFESFRQLGDKTYHLVEDMRVLATTQMDHFEYKRLSASLAKSINDLESLMLRQIEDEQRDIIARRSTVHDSSTSPDPTDELLVSLAQVEAQEEIIREREEGILLIQRDVVNLRGLFQSVAYHVGQQGAVIDNIEANLVSATERTRVANSELRVTNESTQRKNVSYCYLLVFLIIVAISAVIIIKSQ